MLCMTTRIACRRAACVATRPARRALLADDDASADQFTAGSSDSQTFQVQRLPASCVQPVQTTRSTCEHDVPLAYRHGGPQPALAVVRPTVSSYYDVELRQLSDDVSMSSCQQQTTLLWRHLAAVIIAALPYLLQRCLNSAKSIAILFISMANSPGRQWRHLIDSLVPARPSTAAYCNFAVNTSCPEKRFRSTSAFDFATC